MSGWCLARKQLERGKSLLGVATSSTVIAATMRVVAGVKILALTRGIDLGGRPPRRRLFGAKKWFET